MEMLEAIVVILLIGVVCYMLLSSNRDGFGARVKGVVEGPWRQSLALVGVGYGVPWLIERCRKCNPLLTLGQVALLQTMLSNACIECVRADGRPLVQLLRPIVALAVPDAELAYEIVVVFAGAASASLSKHRTLNVDRPPDVVYRPLKRDCRPGAQMCALQECGCAEAALTRIDDSRVHAVLLETLQSRPPPTCPISLDDLVSLPSGRLVKNVAMIIQRPSNGGDKAARPHVFLYRRGVLERWFADSPAPTNPLTRQPLDPARDFIPLS